MTTLPLRWPLLAALFMTLATGCKGFNDFYIAGNSGPDGATPMNGSDTMDAGDTMDGHTPMDGNMPMDASSPVDASVPGGDGGVDSVDSGPRDGCAAASDCPGIATVPVDCAVAQCRSGACVYESLDGDRDGTTSRNCRSTQVGITVVVGTDCNDLRDDIYVGAWDGPEGDGQMGACNDGLDNDCSGTIDDGVLTDGTTCTCMPGAQTSCAATETGNPVEFPALDSEDKPLGTCALGEQTCTSVGKWGPCVGAVPPAIESCDRQDNDCDGLVDNVSSPPVFRYDADGDAHGASWSTTVEACFAPTTAPAECATHQTRCPTSGWTTSPVPLDDCDDDDAARYPGAQELCNRRDDNCDKGGGIETAEDEDNDGYTSTSYAGCSGGFPRTDCYDKDNRVRPDQTSRFEVGYCLNDNAQNWCFTEHKCAKKSDCMDSVGQEWGPGSVDYDCDGVEEPLLVTPSQSASYSAACASLSTTSCTSSAAPTYAVSGVTCGAVGQHSRCTYDSSTSKCAYRSAFLMTACN